MALQFDVDISNCKVKHPKIACLFTPRSPHEHTTTAVCVLARAAVQERRGRMLFTRNSRNSLELIGLSYIGPWPLLLRVVSPLVVQPRLPTNRGLRSPAGLLLLTHCDVVLHINNTLTNVDYVCGSRCWCASNAPDLDTGGRLPCIDSVRCSLLSLCIYVLLSDLTYKSKSLVCVHAFSSQSLLTKASITQLCQVSNIRRLDLI